MDTLVKIMFGPLVLLALLFAVTMSRGDEVAEARARAALALTAAPPVKVTNPVISVKSTTSINNSKTTTNTTKKTPPCSPSCTCGCNEGYPCECNSPNKSKSYKLRLQERTQVIQPQPQYQTPHYYNPASYYQQYQQPQPYWQYNPSVYQPTIGSNYSRGNSRRSGSC